MITSEIKATGFNHWILGPADMAEPLDMPTHLPYTFTDPDQAGRVPFPDVALASTYQWATHPKNSYPLHLLRNNVPHMSNEEAVERCALRPYMHAVYASQRFIEQSSTDPQKGTVDTSRWRQSMAGYLLKESGIKVSWIGAPPQINVVRSKAGSQTTPELWDMVGIDPHQDGRAELILPEEQSPQAVLETFRVLKTTVWATRLLKIDE